MAFEPIGMFHGDVELNGQSAAVRVPSGGTAIVVDVVVVVDEGTATENVASCEGEVDDVPARTRTVRAFPSSK
jgi:hypothetical protein